MTLKVLNGERLLSKAPMVLVLKIGMFQYLSLILKFWFFSPGN